MTHDEHAAELPRYDSWAPTAFDSAGAFLDDRDDWRVMPVMQTRDSGPYDVSNFETAQKILDDSKADYEVHRFGHWGPGWFEIILIDPSSAHSMTAAGEIVCSLADYPVLDEDDLSDREYEDFLESWSSWGCRDFIRSLTKQFTLKDEAQNLLDAIDIDIMREFYMEHANEPYICESSGVSMNTDHCAKSISRQTLASFLWSHR